MWGLGWIREDLEVWGFQGSPSEPPKPHAHCTLSLSPRSQGSLRFGGYNLRAWGWAWAWARWEELGREGCRVPRACGVISSRLPSR